MLKQTKAGGKIIIELPNTAEVVEVKPGLYVIISNEDATPSQEINVDAKRRLLLKLYKLPFPEREFSKLKLSISKDEIALVKELIKEDKLFVHTKGKYKYIAYRNAALDNLKKDAAKSDVVNQQIHYVILTPEEANRMLANSPHEYIAVKHFDGKVYVARKSFLTKISKDITKALKEEPMDTEALARRIDADPKAVLVVLRILNEHAEVIELQKGMFALAE